jgi:hypothetical protein
MALVASATPAIRESWVANQDDDHLINVFLRMWDGKVSTVQVLLPVDAIVIVIVIAVLICRPSDNNAAFRRIIMNCRLFAAR